jgi:DNA-binding NtrC family response regulator
VSQGRFRKDLYHRLAQLRIVVPPLRERAEDVLPIAAHFRRKYGLQADFSAAAQRLLLSYPWPGNVRELRNAVIACVANSQRAEIHPDDLPVEILEAAPAAPPNGDHGRETAGTLEAAERNLILRVLEQTDGHQEKAARILGISSRTLGRKLKAYKACARAVGVGA